MSWIVRWCLANKPVVVLVTLLLVAGGVFSATRLNQELLPEVEFPLIIVATPVPGAGPDGVDEQVTQPIENAIGGLDGIEGVQSSSSQGFSLVQIEFNLDTDTEEAEDEINNALRNVALPEQAGTPDVQRQAASNFPIQFISLSAEDGNLADLTEYARDEAVPLIEDVDGVAQADLIGGSEEQIEVRLDTEALRERGLPAEAVVGAISASEADIPVGSVSIEGLSTPVRTESTLSDVEALRNLPLGAAGAAGAPQGAPQGAPGGGQQGGPPEGGAPQGQAPPEGGGQQGGDQQGGNQQGNDQQGGQEGGAPPEAAPEPPEPVLLGDVAEIERVDVNSSGISRTDGETSLVLNVTKQREANTVEVAAGIGEALDEVRDELGEDQVVVVYSDAEEIEASVTGLIEKALIGAVLAITIIFLFLRSVRATLVTAVSLPTSVLAALLFSWGEGLTLNIITLAGLTIAVGRVVDDAIVVLENAYRYVQQGYDPEEAALRGTTEVASAITSSTLCTVAVFLPLGLVGGIVSEFFLPLSLTVAFALLASLLVAVTIIPVLVSAFIKRREAREEGGRSRRDDREDAGKRSARRGSNGRREVLVRLVVGVAALLLTAVAAAAIAVLADAVDVNAILDATAALAVAAGLAGLAALGLVALLFLPTPGGANGNRSGGRNDDRNGAGSEDGYRAGEEYDEHDEEEQEEFRGPLVGAYTPMLRWSLRNRVLVLFAAFLLFVGGLATIPFLAVSFFPPSESRLLTADLELDTGTPQEETAEELEAFEDFLLDDGGVESYLLNVAGENGFDPTGTQSGNTAQAFITTTEDADVDAVLDRVSERGEELYGNEAFQAQQQEQGPPAGGLEITLIDGSEEELREASETITNELADNDDLTNVSSSITGGAPEVVVELDEEQAAEAGLSPSGVSQTLGILLSDRTDLDLGETPVSVRVPEGSVDNLDQVRDLPVGAGTNVSDVAEVREVGSPSTIDRTDGDRAVTVSASVASGDTAAVSADVQETLDGLDLPGSVEASIGGESEDIQESFQDLLFSIAIALALVYLVLVVFFGSLVVPLVILLAVPLTTIGAFGGLFLTGTALSVPALLGVLLLIGIVVANSILLIDFVIQAEDRHEKVNEAIVEAGQARLRPILMTALVTIGALTPLALGISFTDSGGNTLISSSLAIPVIGGLATSTFLTLLVVPVAYSVFAGARRRLTGAGKKV